MNKMAENPNTGEDSQNLDTSQEAEKMESGEDWNNWDPAAEHYYNRSNHLGSFNGRLQNAPGYSLLGQLTPKPVLAVEEIPCRFPQGKDGLCWKGVHCLNMHPQPGSKDYDPVTNEKIVKVPINHKHNLLGKNIAPADSVMTVKVVYAKTPWKFYVTSDLEWGCHCKEIKRIDVTREELEKKMTEELLPNFEYKKLQDDDYIEFQLLAVLVRRKNQANPMFCRAIVLQSTMDDDDTKSRKVKVQLLETGEKIKVKFEDVCSLPERYTREVPVLAYKCSLYGISPVYIRWCPQAIARFNELVMDSDCILMIKKTISGEVCYDLFEEKESYQVELRVKYSHPGTGKNIYYSVAELLAQEGFGVLWAPSPLKPEVARISYAEVALFSKVLTLASPVEKAKPTKPSGIVNEQ